MAPAERMLRFLRSRVAEGIAALFKRKGDKSKKVEVLIPKLAAARRKRRKCDGEEFSVWGECSFVSVRKTNIALDISSANCFGRRQIDPQHL